MADVFISYKSERRPAAEHLAEVLELHGFSVWFDYELVKGADFGRQIERELREAKAAVVLWCSLSRESPWVLEEAHLAQQLGIVSPAWIEKVDPPLGFGRADTIDLTLWDGAPRSHRLDPLLADIERRVGRAAASDRAGLDRYERTWRRFGAPSLATFALTTTGQTPEAPRLESVSQTYSPSSASARVGQIEDWRLTWSSFPARDDAAAVARFLAKLRRGAPNSGLEFEVEHHLEQLARENQQMERVVRLSQAVDSLSENEMEEILSTPTPGAIFRDALNSGGEGPEMVVIPAGRFTMGSPESEPQRRDRESPQREVIIESPFALGRFAVTFDEYDRFCDATGAERPQDRDWGRGRRPVINVSYDDAERYCAWLSEQTGEAYRLPSESEWEYACRAGRTTPFWWGSSITPDQANYDSKFVYQGGGEKGVHRKRTEPVDAFEPNPWGLHQVHGNVWEWCADAWNENYNGAPSDGSVWTSGDTSRAVLRGGSWGDYPFWLRSAFRFRYSRDSRGFDIGFRISRTLRGR